MYHPCATAVLFHFWPLMSKVKMYSSSSLQMVCILVRNLAFSNHICCERCDKDMKCSMYAYHNSSCSHLMVAFIGKSTILVCLDFLKFFSSFVFSLSLTLVMYVTLYVHYLDCHLNYKGRKITFLVQVFFN